MRQLAAFPCRGVCTWAPTGHRLAGMRVFACEGCDSEWVRSEAWTPAQGDGTVPREVAAERAAAG